MLSFSFGFELYTNTRLGRACKNTFPCNSAMGMGPVDWEMNFSSFFFPVQYHGNKRVCVTGRWVNDTPKYLESTEHWELSPSSQTCPRGTTTSLLCGAWLFTTRSPGSASTRLQMNPDFPLGSCVMGGDTHSTMSPARM